MSDKKFTPGKWEVLRQNKPNGKLVVVSGGMEIATIETGDNFGIDDKENAKLIAAAPELLEALEACRNSMLGKVNPSNPAWELSSEAIKKAAGK